MICVFCNLLAADATPMYNSSILEDMVLEENAKLISSTFLQWKELCEALILLKVCSSILIPDHLSIAYNSVCIYFLAVGF